MGETTAGPALARMGACYEEMGGSQGLVGEQVRYRILVTAGNLCKDGSFTITGKAPIRAL